ncbi:MAG: hypothetical protein ACFCUW_06890 [Kiloniellaceae bacterium]
MIRQRLRSNGFALALTGALSLVLLPGAAPGSPVLDEDAMRAIDGLRAGTIDAETVSQACLASLTGSEDAEILTEVMTTFLEVPGSDALAALCRAIVGGLRDGSITAEILSRMNDPESAATQAFDAGSLLRAVYFAHLRRDPLGADRSADAEGDAP